MFRIFACKRVLSLGESQRKTKSSYLDHLTLAWRGRSSCLWVECESPSLGWRSMPGAGLEEAVALSETILLTAHNHFSAAANPYQVFCIAGCSSRCRGSAFCSPQALSSLQAGTAFPVKPVPPGSLLQLSSPVPRGLPGMGTGCPTVMTGTVGLLATDSTRSPPLPQLPAHLGHPTREHGWCFYNFHFIWGLIFEV